MTRSSPRSPLRPAPGPARASRNRFARVALERLEDRTAPALLEMGTSQTFNALNNPGFVASGDWNDDGIRDLVLTNYGDPNANDPGENITFLYGQATDGKANGKFGSAATQAVGGTSDSVSYLAVGDLNGDAFEDIVTIQTNQTTEAGTVTVFKGSAVGSFSKVGTFSSAGNRPWAVQIADMNGDGKQDVVVTNIGHSTSASGRNIAVLKNDGAGTLSTLSTLDAANEDGVPMGLAVAKINGDATYDLAVSYASVTFVDEGTSTQDLGVLRVFPGNGDGSFGTSARYDTVGVFPGIVIAAEVDGLPGIDVVVANAGNPDQPNAYLNFGKGTSVDLFRNDGGGNFGPAVSMNVGLISAFMVGVADMNLDGKQDIVALSYGHPVFGTAGAVAVYLQDQAVAGKFVAAANSPFTAGTWGAQSMVVDNFGGNTSPDVAIAYSHRPFANVNGVVSLLNTTAAAAATSTALDVTPSPTTYGTGVTLTATVTSGGGTPTSGTVTFFDGATVLGTGSVNASGVATLTTTATQLAAGTHSLTAQYGGAAGFGQSTSPAFNLTVNKAATTNALQSSAPFVTVGGSVTFTSTVTGPGVPTGTVTFWDGGVQIGSANLATVGGAQKAEFAASTAGWTVGDHQITAKYASQANWLASDSAAVTLTVTAATGANTATTLISSASPSLATQEVTFTATVTTASGVPTGTVEFWEGSTLLGSAPLATVGADQKASVTTSTLGIGTHSVVAKYVGVAGTFNPSESVPFSQVVDAIGTTVTLTSSHNPSFASFPVTFTAVVGSAIGAATGTVTFWDGGVLIGQGTLTTQGGQQQATLTTSGLTLGAHAAITAKFAAQGNFKGSESAAFNQTVSTAPTSVADINPSVNPSFVTQGVTFTAVVNATTNEGTFQIFNGSVEFWDGATLLGIAPLGASGAVFTTSALSVGTHTIVAKYLGVAGLFNPSNSAPFSQVVDTIGTTITVSSSAPSVVVTQPVTFTATVAAGFGAAIGTVTFWDGGVQIGSAQLTSVGGQQQATFTTSGLALGGHAITAKFAAQGNFKGSESTAFNQTVDPIGTTVTISSGGSPSFVTQPVTFTAVVGSQFGPAAGTVTFWDGGVQIGSAGLATVGGQQVATFTGVLGQGTHAVTAKFAAQGNYAGSEAVPVTQVVNQVGTTSTVATSPNPATEGEAVTFTATVTGTVGIPATPTGTVTFLVDGVAVGTAPVANGAATFTTSTLVPGTHAITAAFGGDANFTASTAAAVNQVVNATVPPPPPGPGPELIGFREFAVGAGAGHDAEARFFNPDGSERFRLNLFPGLTGGVRVTSADFNGDGIADMVAGTGPGTASLLRVLDGKTQAELFRVAPFEPSFVGGIYVASGDVTGDGKPEIVVSPDEGGGPRIQVYSGEGFVKLDDFFGIEDLNFRGGARAGVGDMDGDGIGDLVVAAGFGGGPRVAAFDGQTLGSGNRLKLFADLFVFESTLRNGTFVAAGDLDGDGLADLIAGGGPGGAPRITAFGGSQLLGNRAVPIANFFGGDVNSRGGVRVAARNLDGDNLTDLVIGAGTDAGSRVTAYAGKSIRVSSPPPELFAFDAYPGFTGGVYVG